MVVTAAWRIGALAGLAALVLAAAPGAAGAEPYPARPVKIVVSFVPGGIADTTARVIGAQLTASLGKPFVVENRPGAGAIVGITTVAKSPPDGYTLLEANTNVATNSALYRDLPYDADRDLIPVANAILSPAALVVNPALQVRTMAEFVALAKSEPGRINYASVGIGSFPHLALEMLNQMAGIKLVHVPYKGYAPALTAVLANEAQVLASDIPAALPHLQTGKLRALGGTGANRIPILPDMPTIAETGLAGFDAAGWLGFMAPAGTSREIVDLLNAEINRALRTKEVAERFTSQGAYPVPGTPREFGDFIQREKARWAVVITRGGIKAE